MLAQTTKQIARNTVQIESIELFRIELPLHTPYITRLGTISSIDTIVGEVRDSDGRRGIGDATIIEGYTDETRDGGWRACHTLGEQLVGCDRAAAEAVLDQARTSDPHAVSVLQVAIEMLDGDSLLAPPKRETRVPILGPINTKNLDRLADEVDAQIECGYQTLKIKVGWDVDTDLARVALIRKLNAGRALLRIDANQGFSRKDGIRFVNGLDAGADLQLFEQPCDKSDWDSNAAVAAVSRVPVMLDESIYQASDIERAASVDGCQFVKLKISKLTGVSRLARGLNRLRELGITPVIGNGAASDVGCLVEACVARSTVDNAGENNGFLKNRAQLLAQPLRFEAGAIVLEPGFSTELNRRVVEKFTRERVRFAPVQVSAAS